MPNVFANVMRPRPTLESGRMLDQASTMEAEAAHQL